MLMNSTDNRMKEMNNKGKHAIHRKNEYNKS